MYLIRNVERNSMITAVKRSILALPFIVAGLAAPALPSISDQIDSFISRIKSITTFSADIERFQKFRKTERVSRGNLYYDKKYGSVYNWDSPGSYRFFRSDFGAYGVDLSKKEGWKTQFGTPDAEFSRTIDPLYHLLYCGKLNFGQLTKRGTSGSLTIFSGPSSGDETFFFGFDAATGVCRLIEKTDAQGSVTEKTKFYYPSNSKRPVPDAIVITSQVGSEVCVDSVVFKNVNPRAPVTRDHFAIPQQISWHKRISAQLPE